MFDTALRLEAVSLFQNHFIFNIFASDPAIFSKLKQQLIEIMGTGNDLKRGFSVCIF